MGIWLKRIQFRSKPVFITYFKHFSFFGYVGIAMFTGLVVLVKSTELFKGSWLSFCVNELIKWSAPYRWSFWPNFTWDSRKMTTIRETHPTLWYHTICLIGLPPWTLIVRNPMMDCTCYITCYIICCMYNQLILRNCLLFSYL